jgi:hypothetical protein
MMELNSAKEPRHWDTGHNGILGYLKVQKLKADLADSSLKLHKDPSLKEKEPEHPGPLEEYVQRYAGPGDFDETSFKHDFAVENLGMPEETSLNEALAAIAALEGGAKGNCTKAKNQAKKAHDQLKSDYQATLRRGEESSECKMENYYRRVDSYHKDKKEFDEKVSKFNAAIKLYFSDGVMKQLRSFIKEKKYKEVLQELESMVFSGTRELTSRTSWSMPTT